MFAYRYIRSSRLHKICGWASKSCLISRTFTCLSWYISLVSCDSIEVAIEISIITCAIVRTCICVDAGQAIVYACPISSCTSGRTCQSFSANRRGTIWTCCITCCASVRRRLLKVRWHSIYAICVPAIGAAISHEITGSTWLGISTVRIIPSIVSYSLVTSVNSSIAINTGLSWVVTGCDTRSTSSITWITIERIFPIAIRTWSQSRIWTC